MEFFRVFLGVLAIGRGERTLRLLFCGVGALIAVAQILEPILFGKVIDALAKETGLAHFLSLWMVLGGVNAMFSIFLSIASDRYAHRQRLKAMELAFGRTISLPYRFHSLTGSGRVIRTIQTGSDQVFYITLSFFRENIIALSNVLLIVPMAFFLNERLATVLLFLATLFAAANWVVIRNTHVRQSVVESKHQDLTARLIDVMGNVSIVRSFTRVHVEVQLFRDLSRKVLEAQYPVLTWWGFLNIITRLSSMIAMVTIVAFGSALVGAGEASQGEIVTFVGFSTLLIARLDQFSAFINRIVGQMPTAKNLLELIHHESDEDRLQGRFVTPIPQGSVVFEQVTFQYDPVTLQGQGIFDLSFAVEPGETIALVGPTGSGKSTCFALLQRLYSPQKGRILIDGQDIADLAVDELCSSIATVFQDPGLFNRSIYDNILVGRPQASRAEVEEAARFAHAHEFIMAKSGQYDFVVGERGLALSGGERQRLAIARALLKNAPILLLDEATSALDNETEKLVQAAMEKLRQGKTTFIIAHRLSTIRAADRILVLSHGRVVQSGSFEFLRHEQGLFSRLLQAGHGDQGEQPSRVATTLSNEMATKDAVFVET